MTDIQERLLAAFQIEHKDYLEGIRTLLEESESGGGLKPRRFDEMFRLAHSLKGAARAAAVAPVEELAHEIESLFDQARRDRRQLTQDEIAFVRRTLDSIEDRVAGRSERPVVPANDRRPATPAEPKVRPADTLRVEAARLDRVLASAGELLAEVERDERALTEADELADNVAAIEAGWQKLREALRRAPGGLEALEEARVRRQVEDMERQMRSAARHARTLRRQERQAVRSTRQLGGFLQRDLREARMVAAESVFGGTGTLVRELARDLGRQVDVRVSGLDVQADRLVLGGLKDAVLHLLRNAVGHGIEPPEEREATGKDPVGRITLSFAIEGNRLVVTVTDDGRGFDLGRIAEAARHQELIEPGASDPSDRELLEMIFAPGFSTSRTVTDVAGRGMGLSVVRESVVRLSGAVSARSRLRGGAEFRLTAPLSAASQQVLLVRASEHVYAMPADGVDRLLRIRAREVTTVEGRPVVTVDGTQIPLVTLTALLGMDSNEVRVSAGTLPVVIATSGERRTAVAVDDFLGLHGGLVRELGLPLPSESPVGGGMLLADGGVALVLNPFALVGGALRLGRTARLQIVERAAARTVPVILVVDDSLTTRTLEKSILEAHGYEVRLAVNGREALNRLSAEPIDLVVADVQMPELDGFGLLEAVRNDPRLSNVPVVLVTSLERPEDRAKGLALGADAYVVKRQFDQQELLGIVQQLT